MAGSPRRGLLVEFTKSLYLTKAVVTRELVLRVLRVVDGGGDGAIYRITEIKPRERTGRSDHLPDSPAASRLPKQAPS